MRWIGVDVGGPIKGFDVAILEGDHLLGLQGRLTCAEVVSAVEQAGPEVVAIDGPRSCAPQGQSARECERRLNQEICGIRWTPDAPTVQSNDYYGWVVEGLRLYGALAGSGLEVIEVFPTASWTQWLGRRGSRSRAAWTREGLADLRLTGLPGSTNQDQRDAIAAAVTARQHSDGTTRLMGQIVVPTGRP